MEAGTPISPLGVSIRWKTVSSSVRGTPRGCLLPLDTPCEDRGLVRGGEAAFFEGEGLGPAKSFLAFPANFGFLFSPPCVFFPLKDSLAERFFAGDDLCLSEGAFRAGTDFSVLTTSSNTLLFSERGWREGERRALGPSKPVQSRGRALRMSFSAAGTLDLDLASRASLRAKTKFI